MALSRKETLEALGVITGPAAFFGKMFQVRDSLHLAHLYQADFKLSTHMALEEAYDALLPLLDGLIEGYSGLYAPPSITISSAVRIKDPLKFAQNVYDIIRDARSLFTDTWIHNELDELSKIFAILQYKLQYVQ